MLVKYGGYVKSVRQREVGYCGLAKHSKLHSETQKIMMKNVLKFNHLEYFKLNWLIKLHLSLKTHKSH